LVFKPMMNSIMTLLKLWFCLCQINKNLSNISRVACNVNGDGNVWYSNFQLIIEPLYSI
jgi:hypothetical protein